METLLISYGYDYREKWHVCVETPVTEKGTYSYRKVYSFVTEATDDLYNDEERMFNRVCLEFPNTRLMWKAEFKEKNEKITDQARERGAYAFKCENLADEVLEHIAKICIWKDSMSVSHRKNEIYGWIASLMKAKVKNDGNSNRIRNRCFIDSFIFCNFTENFENYDDIAPVIFENAIIHEKKDYRDFDINKLVSDSKEEIISFFSGLPQVFESGDLDILRKYVDTL